MQDEFIIALSQLIKRLAVDHLHIVGDIFDRGGVRIKYWIYCMIIIHWILSGEITIFYGWVLPAEMMRAYAV